MNSDDSGCDLWVLPWTDLEVNGKECQLSGELRVMLDTVWRSGGRVIINKNNAKSGLMLQFCRAVGNTSCGLVVESSYQRL